MPIRHAVPLVALLALLTGPATAQQARRPAGPSVTSLLAKMTLPQKVAQLVMPWIAGSYTAYDDPAFQRIVHWVDSLQVGGIIVSIGSPHDVAAKLNYLQRKARLPLLVASDLEGGTAFRLTGGTGFPTNMGVGAVASEEDAYAMGRIIAEEGRKVGIHMTFSPVADVNSNPANPIINTRSFGGDPALVARLVAAQVRGTQEHGMIATAKHFPGHGDTETDSHIALPVVPGDWARLDSLELVPFRAAIKAGVGAIMSAHVAMPGIDSGRTRPATLVPEIMTGVLRDSLGFKGLVITDALEMGGVTTGASPGETAVRALLAGSDILLQPADPAAAVAAVVQAVRDGRITRARLDRSVRRVLEAKVRLGLFSRRTVRLDSVGYVVGRRASQDLARTVSTQSLVLLRDSTGIFDSLASGRRDVALVTFGEANAGTVGAALGAELRRNGHRVTIFRLHPTSAAPSYDSARVLVETAEYPLFAVSVRPRDGKGSVAMPEPLAGLVTGTTRPALLVSFGSPYLISQVPSVAAYLLAWTSTPMTEAGVAAALAGSPITGTLPIAIPPDYPIGAGLRRPARR